MSNARQLAMWAFGTGGNLTAGTYLLALSPVPWSVWPGVVMVGVGIFSACMTIAGIRFVEADAARGAG